MPQEVLRLNEELVGAVLEVLGRFSVFKWTESVISNGYACPLLIDLVRHLPRNEEVRHVLELVVCVKTAVQIAYAVHVDRLRCLVDQAETPLAKRLVVLVLCALEIQFVFLSNLLTFFTTITDDESFTVEQPVLPVFLCHKSFQLVSVRIVVEMVLLRVLRFHLVSPAYADILEL